MSKDERGFGDGWDPVDKVVEIEPVITQAAGAEDRPAKSMIGRLFGSDPESATSNKREIKRLKSENAELVRDLKKSNEQRDANMDALAIERHSREMAESSIEVLKMQVNDLLAWRQLELERLRVEATIHATKRGKLTSGEDPREFAV